MKIIKFKHLLSFFAIFIMLVSFIACGEKAVVSKINILNTETKFEVNDTVKIEFEVVYSDNKTNSSTSLVTFKSSDSKIATVDSNGTVSFISSGSVFVTVTSTENTSISNNIEFVVASDGSVLPTKVEITNTVLKLTKDSTLQLNVAFTPENVTNKELTYTSSDEKVLTVSDGVVKGVAKGKATVTVVSKADSKITDSVEIEVVEEVTVDDIKNTSIATLDEYLKANACNIVIKIDDLTHVYGFEKSNGKVSKYVNSLSDGTSIYITNESIYMQANGVKSMYAASSDEIEETYEALTIAKALEKASTLLNENGLYEALTLKENKNNEYTFTLDVTKYSGSLNVVDKDEVLVQFTLNQGKLAKVEITTKTLDKQNVISFEFKGLTFADSLLPSDLSSYPAL